MNHQPTLLPQSHSVENPTHRGTFFHLIRYVLSDNMPDSAENDVFVAIDSWSRAQADIILLDVVAGEPSWLKSVLDRYVGFGAPLHVLGFLQPETVKALEKARTSNAGYKATLLGYPQIQVLA